MSELKPGVPEVLGEVELDKSSPDFKKSLAAFAKGLEKVIADFQVEEYVIARRDDGDRMHLVVLPCASEPEERAPLTDSGDSAAAAAAAAQASDDDGLAVSTAKTAEGIVDSVERIKGTRPSRPTGQPLDGLAPGGATAGVGIRRKR